MQPEVELRAVSASSEIMLLQPLKCIAMPQQHSHSSSKSSIQSQACQTSVSSACTCSKSGTRTTLVCSAASRSSHTAPRKPFGSAPTVQQDALLSGRPVCSTALRGTKCPYCQGKALCQHNSLATKAPRQTEYWNHDKNAKTPEQMLAGSHIRAEWKCPTCSHEWQGQVAQRVQKDRGCPLCSKAHGKNTRQATLQAAQHPLLLEWDFQRNPLNGIHPHNTTLGSGKLVHWMCKKCPKGQLHRYQMRVADRTRRDGSGCPYCAGNTVCQCNSLQTHYPTVASEWDFARNALTPAQVTAWSHQLVWWERPVRGSWVQRICDRTDPRFSLKRKVRNQVGTICSFICQIVALGFRLCALNQALQHS